MKKLWLLVMGLVVGCAGIAFADWGNNVVVTFTPTGTRGVYFDSPTTNALGSIPVGASSATLTGFVSHSTGTIANIEYTIGAAVTGGAALATALTPASGEVLVQAAFNDTLPTFEAADIVPAVGSAADVGTNGAEDNAFVGATYADGGGSAGWMDDMPLNRAANLFVQLTLPVSATYTGLQTVTITVTAELAD